MKENEKFNSIFSRKYSLGIPGTGDSRSKAPRSGRGRGNDVFEGQ